jgi:hypothetical protein
LHCKNFATKSRTKISDNKRVEREKGETEMLKAEKIGEEWGDVRFFFQLSPLHPPFLLFFALLIE